MYQVPVGNIEKIRKARKAVKNILTEIGLEDCQNLLKDLNKNSEKNPDEDEAFRETDWVDFTDGYSTRLQKKWPYRSRSLCCNLCKYSSQNIYNFRSHVSRCHGYVQSFCALAPCSQCLFIGHPKVVKKHMLFFHAKLTTPVQSPREGSLPTHRGNERYQCRRCGFPNSSIFAMKKHIILKHLDSLAEQYIGYRLHLQGTTSIKVYCCKVCKVNAGNLDQMLHHMLVEPSHYSVSTQVQSMIHENKNYTIKPTPNGNGVFVTFPSIAPKPQQPQMFNSKSLVLPSNGQPPGTVVALQQLQGTTNSTTLICSPGTNQAFLPPQASALVQLASAEAKGLLQPGATISLRSTLPQAPSMVQLPTVSNVSLQQAPMALAPASAQPQQTPPAQQILVPSGLPANMAAGTGAVPKPAVVTQNTSTNQITLQGTMLTSQSLLSHLIPTGNRVNGMPTYTFAPLQVAMPVSQSTNTPLKAVEQTSNSLPQTKKWITCPLCNELFPSNVFDMHTEVAHQTKSPTSKSESVAARAAFLKKMPDKTVKCLTCKILLSEKSVFQHLLHGLNCLYCSALFFSIKQLAEHVKQHNPTSKAYCDFLRQKYRVYSKGIGGILFPYFDVHTTAPKEVLGDTEVNLALVTNSLDLIFFKLQPSSQPEICPAPVKINSAYCPFCDEKFHNESKHLQHLKQKHFVAPTIHAILKTEAFKCIYCNGVYTGKVTQQAVMLHIQRCRCSPKQPQPPKPTAPPQQPPKPAQQVIQPSGLYFLQVPQGLTMKQTIAPTRVIPAAPSAVPRETEAELQSKKRLEAALRQVIEDNKREREERAAMRKKREHEKMLPPPEPEIQSDPAVKLLLEPTTVERRCNEERRDFISKYFNLNPYTTKSETDELCRRLSLTKAELAAHFSKKRSKCMKSLKRSTAAVLLGFNMTELSKLKHNLIIPEQQPTDPTEQPTADATEEMENGEDGPEPMDESGNAGEVEQME
ncbi:activity-dependent neuroprotector homeobox protein 2b [Xiphias gladius]|uniref:activity-dependent neuroprotector homeobox protein 2b n=1 Tax=Xiphias gladius TaxID=8245 RepID=UPI001A99B8BE|nr:activity-dependent neuroprotector homeobox protein 2b [Xiphias gladius]XP_039977600.1 activity-dependent neuroprotector homeobox protein 2b [Xiphias gladius]XP_039977601.1 activity-dependent neuroprotector homeobox protein 2b [Xiphias gladius]XP_039977602.1 activity-dependent neuroprotector homeobox protein 2b [Xiphias gladius]XP_039977604.1 activity-dependent neuroprotector homeobox protein 2b [Xiphias gladius]